jgi:DNA-binding NarL/FixJ family response regulator
MLQSQQLVHLHYSGKLVLNSKEEKAISDLSLVRILMVDDFVAWQRFVFGKLQEKSNFRVIGAVTDGLEAVQQAKQLQPDLIILDIGLPKLNGIEAARRIRDIVPQSKILFVTGELDLDVMREALNAGGDGYIIKSDAEDELLAGVEAVLSGQKFVSRRFAAQGFAGVADSQAAAPIRRGELDASLAAPPSVSGRTGGCHEVQFYADEAIFLDRFSGFIRAALKGGNTAIFIGTEPHRNGILQRLQAYDLDIRAAIFQGRYLALDAAEILSAVMINDQPDRSKFLSVMSDLIMVATKAAKAENPPVAICGECAALLRLQGMATAAIRLEELWGGIVKTCDIDILCGYSSGSFRSEEDAQYYRRICEEHSAVLSS